MQAALARQEPCGVDHPAVDVELVLMAGGVADPHGSAAVVSGDVVDLPLFRRALAVQGIEDIEPRPGQPAGMQKPMHKGVGFLLLAGVKEAGESDRGVARPREAIVPVATFTDGFRERGRGGGDRSPGGGIGEEAQSDEGADNRVGERALVPELTGPVPPPPIRLIQKRES
jgi:hypothetical protein